MIGMLLTAVLSASSGQQPDVKPMENNPNIIKQDDAQILTTDQARASCPGDIQGTPQQGYPVAQNYGACAPGGACPIGGGCANGACCPDRLPCRIFTISEPGAVGIGFQGHVPTTNRGSYCCLLGTYVGPYPTGMTCPGGAPVMAQPCGGYGGGACPGGYGNPMGGYPGMGGMGMGMPMMGMGMPAMGMGGMGMGGMPGGMGVSYGPPIVLPPGYSLVCDADKGQDKNKESPQGAREHKEIKGTIDEIKGTLDRDIKGTLDKLNETQRQADKRLESIEKASLSTEERVRWIQKEMEQQRLVHEIETKLDQRMYELHRKLDMHDNRLMRHDDKQRQGFHELERQQPRPAEPKPAEPKPTEPRTDDPFKSIESKIDKLQGTVMKDISKILTNMEEMQQMINEEKLMRQKIEDRLKALEKNALPKGGAEDKESPKEKEDFPGKDKESAGLPKVRVAQVSRTQEGVPANKAIVIVTLPADAKLYLDNRLSRAQGTQRTFVTPVLEPGGTYTYSFRMEVMQNGQVRSQTQNITFQPGRRVNVNFGPSNEIRVAGHRQ